MHVRRSQRPYNVAYYARNRAAQITRVRVRQSGTLEFLRALRRVESADRGERFEPHQMDFDHRTPSEKRFNLTASRAMLVSKEQLLAEIAKCDVVCANCHAGRTARLVRARGERQ